MSTISFYSSARAYFASEWGSCVPVTGRGGPGFVDRSNFRLRSQVMRIFLLSRLRVVARLRLPAVVAVCFLLLTSQMHAQALSGMTGTVTDSTGAVIPDAKVTVTNNATAVTSDTVTSSAGSYSITDLIPGIYTVKIEKAGFKSSVHNSVYVDPAKKS